MSISVMKKYLVCPRISKDCGVQPISNYVAILLGSLRILGFIGKLCMARNMSEITRSFIKRLITLLAMGVNKP